MTVNETSWYHHEIWYSHIHYLWKWILRTVEIGGDIGWDGPRLTSFPVAFRISLHWSGVAAKRGWVLLGDDNFFAWKNVSEHGRPESGVARYSSSWFSYTIGSLPQGPKLRSLTHSTSTSKTLSPDTRFAHVFSGCVSSQWCSSVLMHLACWPLESLPNYEKLKAIVIICFFVEKLSTGRLKIICFKLTLPETNSQRPEKLVIPKGNFHLQSVDFQGL